MTYPTILSLPDGSDLIIEQTPTTLEIRLSIPAGEADVSADRSRHQPTLERRSASQFTSTKGDPSLPADNRK